MTRGFYDHRRSRLKFMNIIKQNEDKIHIREKELEKVRFNLQNSPVIYGILHLQWFFWGLLSRGFFYKRASICFRPELFLVEKQFPPWLSIHRWCNFGQAY